MGYLEDIKGSDHMQLEWGDYFKSWYRTIKYLRSEEITYDPDLTFKLNICEYQYRFVMPPRVEFSKGLNAHGKIDYGIISYSEPERLLGVFRFPWNEEGFFSAPIAFQKTNEDVINFTSEQLKDLINKKKVLTFEAFKIPYFGFEYFSISDFQFSEIEKTIDKKFSSSLQSSYVEALNNKVSTVKDNISKLPNYLLILQNVLDLRWQNETEISIMTGGLLHFGI